MKEKIKSSLKSNQTDDWLDIHVVRPFAYYWAVGFNKFDIHPNTVTIISMFVGAAAAFFFCYGSFYYEGMHGLYMNLIGILLLCIADVLDCTDGQLARMTGKKSRLGRILDGLAGFTWFVPIYYGLIYRIWQHHDIEFSLLGIPDTETALWIFMAFVIILVHISGPYSMSSQQRLADYYIQCHLFFLKDEQGSELDNSASQQKMLDATPKEEKLWRMFLKNYIGYTKAQEKVTPEFQNLMSKLKEKFGDSTNFPKSVKDAFLSKSLWLMKYNTMLTFNFRSAIFFTCLLLDLPLLYFLIEVFALEIFARWINHTHEKFCKEIAATL